MYPWRTSIRCFKAFAAVQTYVFPKRLDGMGFPVVQHNASAEALLAADEVSEGRKKKKASVRSRASEGIWACDVFST